MKKVLKVLFKIVAFIPLFVWRENEKDIYDINNESDDEWLDRQW